MLAPTEKERTVQRESRKRHSDRSKGTNVVSLEPHGESNKLDTGSNMGKSVSKKRKKANHALRDINSKDDTLATADTDRAATGVLTSNQEELEKAKAERKSIETDAARLVVEAAYDSEASEDALEIFQKELQKKMNSRAKTSATINKKPKTMTGLMPPEEEARFVGNLVTLHYDERKKPQAVEARQQITPPQSEPSRNPSLPRVGDKSVQAKSTAKVAQPLKKPEKLALQATSTSQTLTHFQATITHLHIRHSGKPGFRPLLLSDCLTTPSFLDMIVGAWRLTKDSLSEVHLTYDWLVEKNPARYVILKAEELDQLKEFLLDDILEFKCWEHKPGCTIQVVLVPK